MSWVEAPRQFGGTPRTNTPTMAITNAGGKKLAMLVAFAEPCPAKFTIKARVWFQLGEGEHAGLIRFFVSPRGNALQSRRHGLAQPEFRSAIPERWSHFSACRPQALEVVEIGADFVVYRVPDFASAPPAIVRRQRLRTQAVIKTKTHPAGAEKDLRMVALPNAATSMRVGSIMTRTVSTTGDAAARAEKALGARNGR